jgi:molybdenum cofactor biosynthesis enzyme MoaA
MTLELTAKCNFRCPYCYCVWHEHPSLAKPELDAAGWKEILAKCAADGVDDILFTGGEALLRHDLFDILGCAGLALRRKQIQRALSVGFLV